MIITKAQPFTKKEIKNLQEQFDVYIKTVIDVKRQVCSAGADRHFESEQVLIIDGSKQSDLWGGGIDLGTKIIDYQSFINIRPNDDNNSDEIGSPKVREKFGRLMRYFFQTVYDK